MWVNMKPYSIQFYNPIAVPYTVGITGIDDAIDQKRLVHQIIPGHHITINVFPQLVLSSADFNAYDLSTRQCKLKHEVEGLNFLNGYTRRGCELECAMKKAVAFCRCLPWNYPNNFTSVSMCDMFGAHCFDKIMSDEKFYKQCQNECMEDCEENAFSVWYTSFPLNLEEVCIEGNMIYEHINQTFQQHFAFESYKILVDGGSIPNLIASYVNGSLCRNFVRNYASFVSIQSPSTNIIKSRRERNVSFNDQLGKIGGIIGLFTGMSLLSLANIFLFFYTIIKSLAKDFVQIFSNYSKEGKYVSLKENEQQSPINSLCINCCHGKKIHCNEEHIKNLFVS